MDKSLVERLEMQAQHLPTLKLGLHYTQGLLKEAAGRIRELEEKVESLGEDFDMMEWNRDREREKVAAAEQGYDHLEGEVQAANVLNANLQAQNARLREEKVRAYQDGYNAGCESYVGDLVSPDHRRRAELVVGELDEAATGWQRQYGDTLLGMSGLTAKIRSAADLIRELAGLEGKKDTSSEPTASFDGCGHTVSADRAGFATWGNVPGCCPDCVPASDPEASDV